MTTSLIFIFFLLFTHTHSIPNMSNPNKLMTTKLIAITGRKFHGKDTAGDFLVKNYRFKKLSFAEPLKKACKEIFDLDDIQVNGVKKDEIDPYWNITPRSILNFVGTDLLRNQLKNLLPDINEDIWLRAMEKRIKKEWSKNPYQKIVITDLRFENEVTLIKKLGGKIIRIKRNLSQDSKNHIHAFESIHALESIHASESQIDNLCVDYEIDNSGTKSELFNRLQNI